MSGRYKYKIFVHIIEVNWKIFMLSVLKATTNRFTTIHHYETEQVLRKGLSQIQGAAGSQVP